MVYQISNKHLTASISDLGAELISVKNREGSEFIFQPNLLWPGQAKTLFPNVGLAKDDYAIIRGKKYSMRQHGFLKDLILTVTEQHQDRITFQLRSGAETMKYVPYIFELYICFQLQDNQLIHSFKVVNLEDDTMYFGLASHTGFCTTPDSYVDFGANDQIIEVCRKEMKFLSGEKKAYPTENGILPVSPQYYADGAHILENFHDKKLRLVNPALKTEVTIDFFDFDRITLWSTPDAETVLCMMPWLALPDYENTNHIFEEKPGNVCLLGGGEFTAKQTFWFSKID